MNSEGIHVSSKIQKRPSNLFNFLLNGKRKHLQILIMSFSISKNVSLCYLLIHIHACSRNGGDKTKEIIPDILPLKLPFRLFS